MGAFKLVVPKNTLWSYFYLKSKEDWRLKQLFDYLRHHKIKVFIDSGAFSLFGSQKKETFRENWEQALHFTRDFILFLEKWWDYIDCFAEMDLDTIIGYEKVLELRNMFPKKMRSKMMPVFHPETRDFKIWQQECNDFPYVALGSCAKGNSDFYYQEKLNYSHKIGTKVHGFALVNTDILAKFPFYSADSSSWLAANRWGSVFLFDKNTGGISAYRYNAQGQKLSSHFEKLLKANRHNIGFDISSIMDKTSRSKNNKYVSRVNRLAVAVNAYMQLEEYLTNLWGARGLKFTN